MANYKSNWKRKLFDSKSSEPFKISRSKIDLFTDCPRCFYLDIKMGISRPSMPAFTLNNAVDHLLKKEFDIHRAAGSIHPLLEHYKVKATPFNHPKLDEWRQNFIGIQYLYEKENFLVFGAVDDIWINDNQELIVVDYKATSKDVEIRALDDTKWHDQYRRQMEIYQWLLRQNGFKVSPTGYFVYVNGRKDRKAFDGKLEFAISLIPYTGSSDWIPNTLSDMKKLLMKDKIPPFSPDCEHCKYVKNNFDTESTTEVVKEEIVAVKTKVTKIKKTPEKDLKNIERPTLF